MNSSQYSIKTRDIISLIQDFRSRSSHQRKYPTLAYITRLMTSVGRSVSLVLEVGSLWLRSLGCKWLFHIFVFSALFGQQIPKFLGLVARFQKLNLFHLTFQNIHVLLRFSTWALLEYISMIFILSFYNTTEYNHKGENDVIWRIFLHHMVEVNYGKVS